MAYTELQGINHILGAVGQAPVTSLVDTNPDVAIARSVLSEISREVQGEGWSFNREEEYTFLPEVDQTITIPDNVLSLDLSRLYCNYGTETTTRSGKLYNKTDHTFLWPAGMEVVCDVIWLFDLADVPSAVRDFILNRAATQCCMRMVGDSSLYQTLQQREALSRAIAMEYECREGDYSMFGSNKTVARYTAYTPFDVLIR